MVMTNILCFGSDIGVKMRGFGKCVLSVEKQRFYQRIFNKRYYSSSCVVQLSFVECCWREVVVVLSE